MGGAGEGSAALWREVMADMLLSTPRVREPDRSRVPEGGGGGKEVGGAC